MDKPLTRHITPKQYQVLTENDQDWYAPEWKTHKEKKVRSYCECDCCGHSKFTGWVTETTPIGEAYRYRLLDGMAASLNGLARYYDRKFLERSNSLFNLK